MLELRAASCRIFLQRIAIILEMFMHKISKNSTNILLIFAIQSARIAGVSATGELK
jgi:hypothetical protein